MAIFAREAAYSGQRITWKQFMASKQSLAPKEYAWGDNPVPPRADAGQLQVRVALMIAESIATLDPASPACRSDQRSTINCQAS